MKYYARIFNNFDEEESLRKQSGAFIIDGLSKKEFLSNNFEFKVCTLINEYQAVWFDLKQPRGTKTETSDNGCISYEGILSDILEYDDKLIVKWALNSTDYIKAGQNLYNKFSGILIKIGMNERMTNTLIKRIELRNYTLNDEW
jgi:hypothetical protein